MCTNFYLPIVMKVESQNWDKLNIPVKIWLPWQVHASSISIQQKLVMSHQIVTWKVHVFWLQLGVEDTADVKQ